tara:strand:+ start:7049 stop:8458 length:1410 start_codon:yes stop_codon:yes gene_type:complete
MSKRKSPEAYTPPTKRSRHIDHRPFGFDYTPYVNHIANPVPLGHTSHLLSNPIVGFLKNDPCFFKPEKVFRIENISGMFANVRGTSKRFLKSVFHTPHTVSAYKMAHDLLKIIHKKPRITLVRGPAKNEMEVDVRECMKTGRNHAGDQVWLNAMHQGRRVVLKTSTKLTSILRYLIEAVIHDQLMRRTPSYVPALKLVAFAKVKKGEDDLFVICSEQLRRPSVYAWIRTLPSYHHKKNLNIKLWHMVRNVCLCMRNLQRHAQFTHRDCHSSNVYYDDSSRSSVKFIDYDWSSIIINGHKLSVPRELYDTARHAYARNKSVDMCVFLRTIGPALIAPPALAKKIHSGQANAKESVEFHKWMDFEARTSKFYKFVYNPLMERYERESERFLKANVADKAAMQLLKLNMGPKGTFGHFHGVKNLTKVKKDGGIAFDYRMGYFEWRCMTPESILSHLEEFKEHMYPQREFVDI